MVKLGIQVQVESQAVLALKETSERRGTLAPLVLLGPQE